MCFKNLRFLKQVPTVLEITDGEKWKNNFWSDLLVVMIFLFIMGRVLAFFQPMSRRYGIKLCFDL